MKRTIHIFVDIAFGCAVLGLVVFFYAVIVGKP